MFYAGMGRPGDALGGGTGHRWMKPPDQKGALLVAYLRGVRFRANPQIILANGVGCTIKQFRIWSGAESRYTITSGAVCMYAKRRED